MSNRNYNASILTQNAAYFTSVANSHNRKGSNHMFENAGFRQNVHRHYMPPQNMRYENKLEYTKNNIDMVERIHGGINQWLTKISDGLTMGYHTLATDQLGNIYVTGNFSGQYLSSVGTDGSVVSMIYLGGIDIFITKYTPAGLVSWVRRIGGANNQSVPSIATDKDNNIYIAGQYATTSVCTFNSGSIVPFLSSPISGDNDIFVTKYDQSGNNIWLTKIAGMGSDSGPSIATDKYNNIYIAGQYATSSVCTFNRDNTSYISSVIHGISDNIFIAKYNSDGYNQWLTRMGGVSYLRESSLTTDSIGNIFVTGKYANPLSSFNSDSSTIVASTLFAGSSKCSIFVAKYTPLGINEWLFRVGDTSSAMSFTHLPSIATFEDKFIYVTTIFHSSISTFNYNSGPDRNSLPISTISTSGLYDIVIAKYTI